MSEVCSKKFYLCALILILSSLSACGTSSGSDPDSYAPPALSLDTLLSKHCPSLKLRNRLELTQAVELAAREHSIEPGLVFAVITAESNCRRTARSRSGAQGLMQLMPKTARWLGVRNPYSKKENVAGGAKYLSYLLELFDSNMPLAIAAYNAGPTRVRKHGGIPPYSETRNYVRKVISYYEQYRVAR